MSEMIERVLAQAIADSNESCRGCKPPCADDGCDCISDARTAIAAHEAALAEAGYVIVPREPTEAMIEAGAPYQSEAVLRCAWRAMVEAGAPSARSLPPMEEGDRQLTLLSLALCSLLRPGFDMALGLIADRLSGREMFEKFKELNSDQVGPAGGRAGEG